MKVNNNTISLTKESSEYQELENIIKKIASENEINSVETVNISLDKNQGLVGFKTAEMDSISNPSEDDQLNEENVEEETVEEAIATEMA